MRSVFTRVIVIVAAAGALAMPARAQDLRTDEGPEEDQINTGVVAGGAKTPGRGLVMEPALLTRAIDAGFDRFGGTGTPSNGFYVELSNMITGSGWVSIGPGYRRELFDRNAFVDVSAAVSWRAYNMVQGRFEFPRLAGNHFSLGTQVMWQDQTQINYFGIGADSSEADKSQFRLRTIDSV